MLCPFQDLRAHPGTLNDELGFAFMASLCARFVLLLLWCHSTCQLTLLSLAFRRSTVLRAQAFQQDHGKPRPPLPGLRRQPLETAGAHQTWETDSLTSELPFGLVGRRAPPPVRATGLCPILPLALGTKLCPISPLRSGSKLCPISPLGFLHLQCSCHTIDQHLCRSVQLVSFCIWTGQPTGWEPQH